MKSVQIPSVVSAILTSVCVLVGCSSVTRSSSVRTCTAPEARSNGCNAGLAYSLPKAQILVTASRRPATPTDPVADFASAKADLAQAQHLAANAPRLVQAAAQKLADDQQAHADQKTLDADQAALDQAQSVLRAAPGRLWAAQRAVGLAATAADAQVRVTRLSAAVTKDATQLTTAQAALVAAIGKPASADTIAADRKSVADAQAALDSDQSKLDSATGDLDVAEAAFPKWKESVTLTVLSNIPDPSARYVANLSHEATRDDTLKLSVVNGLLSSSTVTSTDQTPNLLVQLADTVITFGALGAAPAVPVPRAAAVSPNTLAPGAVASPPEESPPIVCPYDLVRTFDPLDPNSRNELQAELQRHGSNISIDVDAGPDPVDTGPRPSGDIGGLVYRVATPVTVRTVAGADSTFSGSACPLQSLPVAQSVYAVVPDSRSSFVIRSSAGAFTTTNLSFGFSGGMLTDYTAQRPSEIAAVANIPVRIAQDIVQIPTQLLQLRLNYDTQATALVNAQTALQQAQINRATAVTGSQTALVSAQTALQQARIAQPTAVLTAQTAFVNAQTALEQAQVAQPTNLLTSQTALVNAETTLQQAQVSQSTSVTQAKTALVTAMTNLQQAQQAQPTAAVSSQTALIQAHAALIQAEDTLQKAITDYQAQQNQSGKP